MVCGETADAVGGGAQGDFHGAAGYAGLESGCVATDHVAFLPAGVEGVEQSAGDDDDGNQLLAEVGFHGWAGGAAEPRLLTFNAYLQNADNYEGYEFGAESHEPCLGVWCDENMTLQWLNMLSRRIKFSKAKLLWTYTPIHGVSAAMKEFLGKAPRYLRSKVAELLPSAQVPGLSGGAHADAGDSFEGEPGAVVAPGEQSL